jgi:hypothetical protein
MGGKKKSKKKDSQRKDSKKHTKKNAAPGAASDQGNGGLQLLGANTGISSAVLGAVVSEVAQAAVSRILSSDTKQHQLNAAKHSVTDAAAAVKAAVEEVLPSIMSAVSAVKDAADVKPAVTEAVDRVKESVTEMNPLPAQTIDRTVDRVEGTIAASSPAITNAIDLVTEIAEDVKHTAANALAPLSGSDAVQTVLKPDKPSKKKGKKRKFLQNSLLQNRLTAGDDNE